MKQKNLGRIQIIIGVVALIFFFLNIAASSALAGRVAISTTNIGLLLFGIFAILTGFYTQK